MRLKAGAPALRQGLGMAHVRVLHCRLACVATAGLLAVILSSGAAGQAAPAWTAADRAAALQALALPGAAGAPPSPSIDDEKLATLTQAYAARELGQRVRPGEIDRMWSLAAPPRDVAAEMSAARAAGRLADWLREARPHQPGYQALQLAADRYRKIVAAGGWRSLPVADALEEGDRATAVALLRARLAAEGYPVGGAGDPTRFDVALRRAVSEFQRRHDLPADGLVNAQSREALNVPADQRLAQIEANLERWRWLPHELPATRIEVDIAGAQAHVLEAGREVLAMKVVVGDPRHRTPMFGSRLEAVVFNPPWNVPASIASAELLPKEAKNPGYLAANDFVYVDGHLQQKAGPKSALGQYKFDLPSPFGVYLHDTPSKSAFGRRMRALSHGCMRLEKPRELAELLLAPQGWTAAAVAAAVATGKTQAVALKTPRPLYVMYWTAVADASGQVTFQPDVYGWDRPLQDALAAGD